MKKQGEKRKKSGRLPVSQHKQKYPPDWVPIQVPPNLEEMFQHWVDSDEPNVGWCLLCDSPIRTVDDMIPGTNSHNCAAGRALDEKIRAAEAAEQSPKIPSSGANPQPEAQVGVFWRLKGKLIIDSTPLSRAERYADALTHAKGHSRCWSELQAAGSVPADVDFDEVSRGRVTYDPVRDQFLLLRDPCIPAKAIRDVIRTMHLPRAKVVVTGDPHYRCPRCMTKVANHE